MLLDSVSRIVAAAIEQNFDDEGIIFPKAISPFNCYIVRLIQKVIKRLIIKVDKIYSKLIKCGIEVSSMTET